MAALEGTGTNDSSELVQPDGGEAYKVVGDFDEAGGIGVLGRNRAASSTTTGVRGETASADDGSVGVSGRSTAADVDAATIGVEGISAADANHGSPEILPAGVEGTTTGENAAHGVRGVPHSIRGRGVTGFATTEEYEPNTFTASAIGVTGYTDRSGDEDGISDAGGVFGHAIASSGTAYGVLGRNNSPDGWGVLALDTSGDGLALRASGDTELGGDTAVTGDTDLDGELAFADATPQRTAGPIAKGYINSDESIENAVNVNDAFWHDTEERYRLVLTDEYCYFNAYTTVVTPVDDCTVRVTSNSGDLIVECKDSNGNNIQTMFQFLTHKLPSGAQTTAAESSDLEATAKDDGQDDGSPDGAATAPADGE